MIAAALIALAQPVLPHPALPAQDTVHLVHTPREGAVIAVAMDQTSSTEVATESECPIVDGERQEDEAWFSEGGGGSEFELSIQFEDTFESVDEDGRVRGLVRRFEEIAGESVDVIYGDGEPDMREEAELASPLEGRAVRFTWDDEDEEYAASFLEDGEDEEMDELLLHDQRIDAFGHWFLPPADEAEVEVGDGWDLGLDRWNGFLTMGGEFWIDVADAEPLDEQTVDDVRDFERQLLENGEGEMECRLAEIVEEDGLRIAVIGFEGTLDTHAEQDYTADFDGTRSEVSARVEHEMKIEGTCRWDISSGRALGIETRIAMTTTTTEHSVIEAEDIEGIQTYGSEFVTVEDTVTEAVVTFEERGG